jgi:putative membrane protein
MITDWLLSVSHFVLVFSLVAILAAQWGLLRAGMTASALRLAAALDRGYGASALLLVGVGFARVWYGVAEADFYLSNPVFWIKIGLFTIVALLSVPPTVQLIRWTRQASLCRGFVPRDEEISVIRRWLTAEAGIMLLIPFVAAAVARGYGLS